MNRFEVSELQNLDAIQPPVATPSSENAGAVVMQALEVGGLLSPSVMAYEQGITSETMPPAPSEAGYGWLGSVTKAVREQLSKRRAALGTAAGLSLLALGAAGCDSQSTPDRACFSQLTSDQKSQLDQYINDNDDVANVISNNPNGTQDVCVLEGNEAHYYNQHDRFNDYELYLLLANRESDLVTYGLIRGDLTLDQALTLQMLADVQSDGTVYRPYSNSNGVWSERHTTINHVTYVQYGHSQQMTFKSGSTKPPKNYTIKQFTAADPHNQGDASSGSVKKVVPANTYRNPAKPSSSAAKVSGGGTPPQPNPTTKSGFVAPAKKKCYTVKC